MPQYHVRVYYTYLDSFEVEADSPEEANALAEQYIGAFPMPPDGTLRPDTERVRQCDNNRFVDYDSTCVEDEDGNIYEL